MRNEVETRERILRAAMDLLAESRDVDRITVRMVAQKAGVGIGLINYHFQTRDNLLSTAIGGILADMATDMAEGTRPLSGPPEAQLREMIKRLYAYAEKHEKQIQFVLSHGIVNGDLNAVLYLVPVLREIFPEGKDEIQLRVLAMQILLPIQVASISPAAFHQFTGIDLHHVQQREDFIDALIDNLIP